MLTRAISGLILHYVTPQSQETDMENVRTLIQQRRATLRVLMDSLNRTWMNYIAVEELYKNYLDNKGRLWPVLSAVNFVYVELPPAHSLQ